RATPAAPPAAEAGSPEPARRVPSARAGTRTDRHPALERTARLAHGAGGALGDGVRGARDSEHREPALGLGPPSAAREVDDGAGARDGVARAGEQQEAA